MAEQTTTAAVPDVLSAITTQFCEPAWLKTARAEAWQSFEAMPLTRIEKSDLTKRSWNIGTLPATPGTVPDDAEELLAHLSGPRVVVVDGTVVKTEVPPELAKQGVVFGDLHTLLGEHGSLIQKHLFSVVPANESKWTAANAALWHGGVFLYVPRGVAIDTVFMYVSILTEANQGAFPRVLIVGGENSAFSFAEVHVSGENAAGYPHSSVTEVVADAGANIRVMSVNELRKGATNYLTQRAKVGKDAVVNWVFGDVGDGFTVAVVESVLSGTGSRSLTKAVGIGFGRQHMDLTASMVHQGRYSESDIRLQGVLRGRANAIYRSSTHIERGAIGAGSEQHDRMLMLDTTARADAIPMLLIDENDVQRCGHAASIGKLDPDHIYYLMSRGIPKDVATRMMIWGYLEPIVEAITVAELQTWLTGLIERKLTS